ncbi:MAG: pyroglutamyl-peptidase I [Planctomycetota bacterium]
MSRILLTAFEPYDRWPENSSWEALVDFTSWYEGPAEITTRRYPVDLGGLSERLRDDLQLHVDYAIHCGQAPGCPAIRLEAYGLNVSHENGVRLIDGPDAYRSSISVEDLADALRSAGVPATASYHAGTYLCNAAMYLSCHYSRVMDTATQSLFMHLPLTPGQAAREGCETASMSTSVASQAIATVVQELTQRPSVA